MPRPPGDSLSVTVPAALAAGSTLAILDVVRGGGPGVGSALIAAIGLQALPSLLLGLGLGLVLWGWRNAFGEAVLRRWWAALRDDRALDRRVTAALIAAGGAAAVYALFAAMLALKLVANVQRTGVGALLFAVVITAALPGAVILGAALFRATRPVARVVPRLGPIPACVGMVVVCVVLGSALVLLQIRARLDWRAIDLGGPTALISFGVVMAVWLGAWYGPLARVRMRIPRRGALAAVAAAIAALLPFAVLRGTPSRDALALLTERTTGIRLLVTAGRALRDADGDGYSAFLGGPDCDDHAAAVHPGATEIADNGIDDNCIGGDRTSAAADPVEAPPEPTAPRLAFEGNVLVVLIDTLRADAIGAANPGSTSRTPNLDALAARGTYFSRAYAQAPNTARSIPSIMTSRFPSQIAVDKRFKNFPLTLDDNVTLFELLADAGFETRGFASHYYFDVNPGIRQGFADFDNRGAASMERAGPESAAPRIIPRAVAALDELATSQQRFAMFVHLFEPHSDYLVHDETPPGGTSMKARYRGEVAFADRWVGVLLDALEARGLTGNTAVVVLSDHGEAFGEHRVAGRAVYYHGRTLYDEMIRVPLIITVPGLAPRRVDTPVMLVDVAPTVLEAVGIPRPASFVGRSLAPGLLGDPLVARATFSELLPAPYWDHNARTMIDADGTHKLILRLAPDRQAELYDLVEDAAESRDLARRDRARLDEMTEKLVEFIETTGSD